MSTHRVPARLLAPLIRQWIANDPYDRTLRSLSKLADVSVPVLEKIHQGTRLSVDFYAADRLLTRMGLTYLWYTELAEHYPVDDCVDEYEEDELGYLDEAELATAAQAI